MQVTITINGEQVSREIEPRKLLVHFVREDAGLRGTPGEALVQRTAREHRGIEIETEVQIIGEDTPF